jgi:DNA-binding PadR family transcriptional regulator
VAKTNRAEAREIRGRILKILDLDYPHEVSDRVIALTLNDISYNVNPAILQGYLDYLKDKGYVECRQLESDDLGLTMRVAKLTAKGKDLLEGNIPDDPGVNV